MALCTLGSRLAREGSTVSEPFGHLKSPISCSRVAADDETARTPPTQRLVRTHMVALGDPESQRQRDRIRVDPGAKHAIPDREQRALIALVIEAVVDVVVARSHEEPLEPAQSPPHVHVHPVVTRDAFDREREFLTELRRVMRPERAGAAATIADGSCGADDDGRARSLAPGRSTAPVRSRTIRPGRPT